jgi:predicted dehydrogenase
MRKVRWGVIGAGGIAMRRTIPEGILRAGNAELIAIQNPSRVVDIAKQFCVVGVTSERELLAQPIDSVYIATPVHLHVGQIERAAAAGKHVLCEKPLGLNAVEVARVVAACAASNVSLSVGLMMRFHAAHVHLRDMIAAGRLGTPTFIRAQLSCWYPPIENAWRQDPSLGGGGALADLGTHCLDLVESLFGPIAELSCQTANAVHDYPVEDAAVVTIKFASGSLGTIDCLFNVPDDASLNRLEVYGSDGSVLCENTIGQGDGGTMVWRPRDPNAAGYAAEQLREGGQSGRAVTPVRRNTYLALIEAVSKAILDGVASPVDGAVGLRVQRLLDACYESARSGRRIAVG